LGHLIGLVSHIHANIAKPIGSTIAVVFWMVRGTRVALI
jgi:hypothetical protein